MGTWMGRWGFPGSRSLASVKEVKTSGLGSGVIRVYSAALLACPLGCIIAMTNA